MRVFGVGQENNTRKSGVLSAGAIGALGGALVRNVAPLTAEEHAFYFNDSAKEAIKQKVSKVRINEVEKIGSEFKAGALNITPQAFDVFEKHKDAVVNEPKKALEIVKDSADNIKNGFKSLVSRVDAVGEAKEHIETSSIKSAAKAARPIAYFAIAGALITMCGKIIANACKSCAPEVVEPKKEEHNLTMADILLEGLGTNTEVLFLSNEALNNDDK